jgi:hypothetical protein
MSGLTIATTVIVDASVLERFLKKQEAKKAEDIKGLRLPSYRDVDS